MKDQRGVDVSSDNFQSVEIFERALRAFNTYRGDPVAIIDEALEKEPDFAMGHVLRGHLSDFYHGDRDNLRGRVARALPAWSRDDPGYAFLLGMHAFGLEECGSYAVAEETGRHALDLEPDDCWAQRRLLRKAPADRRAGTTQNNEPERR